MKKIFTLITILVVALVGWQLLSWRIQSLNTPTPSPYVQYTRHATVDVMADGKDTRINDVEYKEGETALDLTKKVANVETKGNGEQAFITSINGRTANDKKHEFWSLAINGRDSEVGAGTYKVQAGDVIAWSIKTY